jgi:hypothetical protein
MSGHNPCTCKGTRQERMKNWYVSLRKANRSYFERPQGALHFSEYSTVQCHNCSMLVRSKALFVKTLPDGEDICQ